jgi:DNA-binding HxlR family transcriptional regulator
MVARNKAEYDAFLAMCPSRKLLDRISDKWVTLILSALGSGGDCAGEPRPMRYSELSRLLAGVSQKMLTQTLRALERDGLVTRTVHAEVPPRVEYALTPLGATMAPPLKALGSWSLAHGKRVEEARDRFDARAAAKRAA